MPQLFLPEIETLAEENPLMYEILFRIQQSINGIPVSSSGASPTPQPAIDPSTGLPFTDANGNPLFTIPQQTNTNGNLTNSQTPSQENGLMFETDPTGQASGGYVFGGIWNPLFKIVTSKDLAGQGKPAQQFLIPGSMVIRGQNDIHGRPQSSFFTNVVDNSSVPLTNTVTQHGVTTQIDIGAFTIQCGGFQVSYNGGSVDPGAFGKYIVFFDDPLYKGGTVTFQAVLQTGNTGVGISKRGRYYLGDITTAGGGGGTGNGGGSGGGSTCFSGNTKIVTSKGIISIRDIQPGYETLTRKGWREISDLVIHNFEGAGVDMGEGEIVTLNHGIYFNKEKTWKPVSHMIGKVFSPLSLGMFQGKVYNLEVRGQDDDTHCFSLANGIIAHNILPDK